MNICMAESVSLGGWNIFMTVKFIKKNIKKQTNKANNR